MIYFHLFLPIIGIYDVDKRTGILKLVQSDQSLGIWKNLYVETKTEGDNLCQDVLKENLRPDQKISFISNLRRPVSMWY